ncbi:hypothetical protein ACNF40_01190 [Cuniculiplasma sp. SKW4]
MDECLSMMEKNVIFANIMYVDSASIMDPVRKETVCKTASEP